MIQKHKYNYSERLKLNGYGYLLVTVKDCYGEYNKNKDLKQPPLEYKVFREVLEFIFARIWFYMITELWIFKPPHNFGEFYVYEQIGTSGFYKNWEKSRKKGKLVEDYNLHTNGRSYYTKWNKRLAKVINKTGYRFVPYRGDSKDLTGKRGLAAYIKECSKDPLKKDFRAHII